MVFSPFELPVVQIELIELLLLVCQPTQVKHEVSPVLAVKSQTFRKEPVKEHRLLLVELPGLHHLNRIESVAKKRKKLRKSFPRYADIVIPERRAEFAEHLDFNVSFEECALFLDHLKSAFNHIVTVHRLHQRRVIDYNLNVL